MWNRFCYDIIILPIHLFPYLITSVFMSITEIMRLSEQCVERKQVEG